MKFTQIPINTFKQIQLNAGILLDEFDPATGTIGNPIGATTGGVNFKDTLSFTDFGDDIDNCPKNMKELKKLESHEVTMGGTFVTVSADIAKMLAGPADIDGDDATHIVPRNDLLDKDFTDIWWVGDYSDENTGEDAGFIAIHLINGLNTDGFQIQSTDKGKGQYAFSFMGHYSMDNQDQVPYEIYVKEGTGTVTPSILLNTHSVTIGVDDTVNLKATVVPAGTSVNWTTGNGSVASVDAGVVTGEGAGNTVITAAITVEGVTYNDTCTVVVTA